MVQEVYQEIFVIVLFQTVDIFYYFILAGELFAKALWSFETCPSVSNNLCGKLVSSLESLIISDESFRVT